MTKTITKMTTKITTTTKKKAPMPIIPDGTPPKHVIEARLSSGASWQEEKELKKQLNYYKEREKWELLQMESQSKKKEEEQKLASLPSWKREMLTKKTSSPPSPSPISTSTQPNSGRVLFFFFFFIFFIVFFIFFIFYFFIFFNK